MTEPTTFTSAPDPTIQRLSAVAVDANDPTALGRFYLRLLGGVLAVDEDGEARLRTDAGGPPLDFRRVPEPHTVKGRLHLDIRAVDYEGAVAVALEAGATRADDVYDGGQWQVLRDPEGNEFCILRPGDDDAPTP